MKVTAKLNNLRISPQKVRLAANLIKGLDVSIAQAQMENLVKGSSLSIGKLIGSAIANAENNFGLDRGNLYVYDVQVGEGVKLRRWMPRAFGRASLILKRSSCVSITLEERVEGKNRKTKEQLDKEKKEREEAKKSMQADATKKEKTEGAEEGSQESGKKFKKESGGEAEGKRGGKQGGWMKKVFRRKSA